MMAPIIQNKEWAKQLSLTSVDKFSLDKMVANYMCVHGFHEASKQFSREAGLESSVDLEAIELRRNIKKFILVGMPLEAIRAINEMDPEFLESHQQLHFRLLQYEAVLLIRRGQTNDAIAFSQLELSPFVTYLKDIEKTMILLTYGTDSGLDLPEGARRLLSDSLPVSLADDVNAALLKYQSIDPESDLLHLLKVMTWSDGIARNHASFSHSMTLSQLLKSGLSTSAVPEEATPRAESSDEESEYDSDD